MKVCKWIGTLSSLSFALLLQMSASTGLCAGTEPADKVKLVEGGKPEAVIVISGECPKSVGIAAEEFQSYIRKISKAGLQLINDKGFKDMAGLKAKTGKSAFVFIGRSKLTDELGISPEGMKSDAYRIVAKGGSLVILGRDDASHDPTRRLCDDNTIGCAGTLYGVYGFLESLGVRFYYPGEYGEVIPERSDIICQGMDVESAPYFQARAAWECLYPSTKENNLWIRKQGFGHGPYRLLSDHPYKPALTPSCPAATSFDFGKTYGATHPEYFMLRDGKRDLGFLCFSNPGTLDAAADWMRRFLDSNKDLPYYTFLQNDGCIFSCECDACKAKFIKGRGHYGTDANIAIDAAISLSKVLAKEYPDKTILYGAYNKWVKPPTSIEKLPSNVGVVLACGTCINSWSEEWRRNSHDLIEGWRKLSPKEIAIFEYYCGDVGKHRGVPMFAPQYIDASIKGLRDISEGGVKVLGEEIFAIADWDRFDPKYIKAREWWFCLNYYITGKLLWNPNADVNAILEEYYGKFYGPAAPQMKRFFTRVAEVWASPDHGGRIMQLVNDCPEKVKGWGEYHKLGNKSFKNPWEVLFTPAILKELSACLDEAKGVATASPYKERVGIVMDGFAYSKKLSDESLAAPAEKAAIPFLDSKDGKPLGLDELKAKGVRIEMKGNKSGEALKYGTTAYLAYDVDALHFLFECKKADSAPIPVKCKERDSKVYDDESVEMFLSPNGSSPGYFQICVNPQGCVLDCDTNGNLSWSPDIKVDARDEGGAWSVKLDIPLSGLVSATPGKGTQWRANLYRNRIMADGKVERQAWSPTNGGYHVVEKFGVMTFPGDKAK